MERMYLGLSYMKLINTELTATRCSDFTIEIWIVMSFTPYSNYISEECAELSQLLESGNKSSNVIWDYQSLNGRKKTIYKVTI